MLESNSLIAHLRTGATTVCNAWSVVRLDGRVYGFTDHDCDLTFDGLTFKANTGMTASAMQKSTGMSVDNTEVIGALSDTAIDELDLSIGRFDDAKVVLWTVNWSNVADRSIRFRGTFGEMQWSAGSFTVELRGLTEALNRTTGRVYQPDCSAILGDHDCNFDLKRASFSIESPVTGNPSRGVYEIGSSLSVVDGWFNRGRIEVLTGRAKGLVSTIKFDKQIDQNRQVEIWPEFGISPEIGDILTLSAGCDKMPETCRVKFSNYLNFRGFPHIPSADWTTAYPTSNQLNNGGSLFK